MDGDGYPTAGDLVTTAFYPLRTDASSFGAFGVTDHTISGGSAGITAGSSAMISAWATCGDVECHFEWSIYNDGTTLRQRYSEYLVTSGGGVTARTGFLDTTDPAEQDVVSVNPSSPSSPAHLTYDGALSSGNDPFLEVAFG